MMRSREWTPTRVLFAALLLASAGCDEGKPSVSSSEQEVTVKGTVTLQGKPAEGGELVFDPSNHLRKMATVRSAPVGKDATYSITTLVGENAVQYKDPRGNPAGFPNKNVDIKSGQAALDLDFGSGVKPQ